MTGDRIVELRTELELSLTHFAQLLGVHPSTIYRWEAMGTSPIRVEPLQQQILAVTDMLVTAQRDKKLGRKILQGLHVGGTMLGLYRLLEAAFSEK